MFHSPTRTWAVVASLFVGLFLYQTAAVAAEAAATSKKYALLVGINDYDNDNLKPLKYTENDVAELASVLRAAGYEVVLLTSSDGKKDAKARPTHANIEKQLTALLAKCKKGDTMLIALAGHGLQFDKDNFFCPEDAVPLSDAESRKTLLSLKAVYDQLERSPSAVKLLLVDACRNDPSSRAVDPRGVRAPDGVAALFSCSSGERAFEVDNYRHGIFFYHVLEGLRGKAKNARGEVTWDTLQEYVREHVADDAPKLLGGGIQQTPSLNAGELRGKPPVLIAPNVQLAARARLLVTFGPLDRTTAERWQVSQTMQPQVLFVVPGGAGDSMGLQRGDMVRRVNGRDVGSVAQTVAALNEMKLGERVELDVLRDKQLLKLLGRYETSISEAEEIRRVRELAQKNDSGALLYVGMACEQGLGMPKDAAEAAKWYRKAADQGYALAQHNLGALYVNGRGVTQDDAEALKWFRKAADQGHAPSQNSAGYLYANGRGVAKDETEAIKWYRKAVEQGEANAQNNLGTMYGNGFGVPKDLAAAAKWYRKAADQGQTLAQNNLGTAYSLGRGVAKDDTEAVKWYRKAAEQGEPNGQNNLGTMYANGRGVAKNDTEAMQWYRKAAEQGHADAENNVGYMCEFGRGVTKDEAAAVQWYRKAADHGNSFAQHNLGNMYVRGRGVAKDEKEAAKWYRKAADQGNVSAFVQLGALYEHGQGVAKDDGEAVKWYRKAADQGNAQGQHNIGWMYANGRGVTKDDGEAMKWFRKAADQGHASGQSWVGFLYATGRGVTKDDAEAAAWYRKAADQGEANAQNNLGALYDAGKGVTKDQAEALKWFRKSAAQNNPWGQLNLGRCYAYGKSVKKDEAEAAKWFRKAAAQNDEAATKEANKELKRLTTEA